MSIIRGEHNKQNPYAQINRLGLHNPKMSFRAKGLWAYLLSLPENWQISVAHLAKNFPENTKIIYKILDELIGFGYCKKSQGRSGSKFQRVEYVILEIPEVKEILPLPEKPNAEEKRSEKIQIILPLGPFGQTQKDTLTIKNDKEEVFLSNDVSTLKTGEASQETSSSCIAAFTVFQPHEYKLKNGEPLSYRTACSFAKYSGKALSRLKANVFWYEEYVESGKPIKRSHEALLQYAVKNDMAARADATFQNSLYARLAMIENPNSGIKVLGTVVHLRKSDSTHESISLALPTSTFANIIDRHIKQKSN